MPLQLNHNLTIYVVMVKTSGTRPVRGVWLFITKPSPPQELWRRPADGIKFWYL